MSGPSRRSLYSVAALCILAAIAVSARELASVGLPPMPLRAVMFVFTLCCPVVLGLAIGVWGGTNAGQWGARGVGGTYLAVVGWAWVEAGSFPVGFHLDGFQAPLFVTIVNMGIFLMTTYFMQALGRSGGRLGARLLKEDSLAAPVAKPNAARLSPAIPDVPEFDRHAPS